MVNALKAEQDIHDAVVNMGLHMGANMLLAKVNAVLFLEPGCVSLDELAQRTGYSLPSVSGAVKILEQAGKIIRHKKPGNKKVYVSFQQNMIQNMKENMSKGHHTMLKPMQDLLPKTIAQLKKEVKGNHSAEKKKQIKAKIVWYENYLVQIAQLEIIFTKITALFNELEKSR